MSTVNPPVLPDLPTPLDSNLSVPRALDTHPLLPAILSPWQRETSANGALGKHRNPGANGWPCPSSRRKAPREVMMAPCDFVRTGRTHTTYHTGSLKLKRKSPKKLNLRKINIGAGDPWENQITHLTCRYQDGACCESIVPSTNPPVC